MPEPAAPSRRTVLPALIAFAAVVLVLPLQLAVQWVWSEPYPALTQPAFAFSANPFVVPDALPKTSGFVVVAFTDGRSREFTADELLGWTAGVSATTILRDTIIEPEHAPPATAEWLRERIAAAGETGTPVSATLRLESRRVDAHTGRILESGVTRSYTIDLTEVP